MVVLLASTVTPSEIDVLINKFPYEATAYDFSLTYFGFLAMAVMWSGVIASLIFIGAGVGINRYRVCYQIYRDSIFPSLDEGTFPNIFASHDDEDKFHEDDDELFEVVKKLPKIEDKMPEVVVEKLPKAADKVVPYEENYYFIENFNEMLHFFLPLLAILLSFYILHCVYNLFDPLRPRLGGVKEFSLNLKIFSAFTLAVTGSKQPFTLFEYLSFLL